MRTEIRAWAEELWRSRNPIDWAEARDLELWLTGPDEDLEQFELEDWA